jgi:chromosome segregation protein
MTITAVQKEYDRIVQAIARETKGLEEEEKKLEHFGQRSVIKEERGDLLRQQDLLIERSRMRSAEYDRLTSRILAIESDIKEKEEDIAALTIALSRLTDEKREHDQKIAVIDTEFYTKREEHDRLIRQIRDLKVDIGKKEAQQQAQGRYNRAMEAVLEMDGVFGTIGELATCKSDYATALSVAAGAKIHFVVVESDQVAAEAIRYLQEHKLGRVTFLPSINSTQSHFHLFRTGLMFIGFALICSIMIPSLRVHFGW